MLNKGGACSTHGYYYVGESVVRYSRLTTGGKIKDRSEGDTIVGVTRDRL